MIDLGTLADLLEHALDAYHPRCDRWCVLPFVETVAAGPGRRRMPIIARRQVCGELGRPCAARRHAILAVTNQETRPDHAANPPELL